MRRSKEVLIIEDDAQSRSIISSKLQVGHDTHFSVEDSESCMGKIRERRPDLVLMNGRISSPEAFEWLGRYRDDEDEFHPPVISTTNIGEIREVLKCFESRREDYAAVQDVISRAVESVAQNMQSKGIGIRMATDLHKTVLCNKQQLVRAFSLLIEAAATYLKRGDTLELLASADSNRANLTIHASSGRLPPKHLEQFLMAFDFSLLDDRGGQRDQRLFMDSVIKLHDGTLRLTNLEPSGFAFILKIRF